MLSHALKRDDARDSKHTRGVEKVLHEKVMQVVQPPPQSRNEKITGICVCVVLIFEILKSAVIELIEYL